MSGRPGAVSAALAVRREADRSRLGGPSDPLTAVELCAVPAGAAGATAIPSMARLAWDGRIVAGPPASGLEASRR